MAISGYLDEFYNNPTKKQRGRFKKFLAQQGLEYEDSVEMTLKVADEATGEMVGTGSIEGKVIKCMAIDSKRRGEGLSAHVLSVLVKEQFNRGRTHIFVFTSPKNIEETSGNVFVGFRIVTKTDDIVLLEMGTTNIDNYLEELKFKTRGIQESVNGSIGAIIVNCNPFTLGHQFIIETAASECEFLYIFVVSEDRSLFPTNVRLKLVKSGTNHLSNVMVLEGGDYIISQATFPRYFLKDCDDLALAQARLDVMIFGEYIAPTLGIDRRYVGEEPYCALTKSYNQAMKEILIPKGVELQIIPRKEIEGEVISASKVRTLIHENKIYETMNLVPPSTYNFLISKEAKSIIDKIRRNKTRN
ncbi:MAG: [citrate (pro-3S)-lyase] ligase [Candidatus Heimdallarchaeota archaeon]